MWIFFSRIASALSAWIRLAFVALPLGPAAGTERVGELRDGEDAFAAEFVTFLRAHVGQQTEVVLLNRDFSAAGLEFALGAVPVQDEVGRLGAGEERGDFLDTLPHFASQGCGLPLERGVVVAVDDFAEADFASEYFGKHERIEGQQQLVVRGELVAEDETNRNELSRLTPPLGRDALNRVEAGFNARSSRREEALIHSLRAGTCGWRGGSLSLVTSAATQLGTQRHVQSQSPFGSLQII